MSDVPRALDSLVAAGMRAEGPPEGWLIKAWHGETLVDLIFHPSGGPIDDGHFERASELDVIAQPMLVASLGDVITTKLLSLTEQESDFSSVLEFARSLREHRLGIRPRAQHVGAVRARVLHPDRGARDHRARSAAPPHVSIRPAGAAPAGSRTLEVVGR
ncbi:MAG: hypothetical protein WKF65_07205 [Gaiellaceae bacterium]